MQHFGVYIHFYVHVCIYVCISICMQEISKYVMCMYGCVTFKSIHIILSRCHSLEVMYDHI